MQADISIAVRELVGFVMRSGDLVSEFTGSSRAGAGARGHRKVQKQRPEGYRAEVPIEHVLDIDGVSVLLRGRADGIYEDSEPLVIDEIKTTSRQLETIAEDDYPQHWAQLRVYAYCQAIENDLTGIGLQLTYYNLDNGELREFSRYENLEDLEIFVLGLIRRYLAWALVVRDWRGVRNDSIESLEFPFDVYRPGQRELAVSAYRAIAGQKKLFARGATGIGKTVAVIFPAVKAMQKGFGEILFFLTARTVGRIAAQDAFDNLRRAGLRIKSLTLTAKEKICFCPDAACQPDECEFAKGHFDRVSAALTEAFEHEALTRDVVEKVARKYRVCPFEFSLDLALWADAVICDYNYVFDPRVRLRRFFDTDSSEVVLLVDEAHNLPDRARSMYSAKLDKKSVLAVRRKTGDRIKGGRKALNKINSILLKVRKLCESSGKREIVQTELPEELLKAMRKFAFAAERWLVRATASELRSEVLEYYFEVLRFIRISELYDDSYITIFERRGKDLDVRLFCLDPSGHCSKVFADCRSSLLFSATLLPLSYYRKMIGIAEDDMAIGIGSPFDPEHFKVLIDDEIDTTFKGRADSVAAVADSIHASIVGRRCNVLAYFPSYRYMEMVQEHFSEKYPEVCLLVQRPRMDEGERERFLDSFSAKPDRTLLGFAVLGGIFGEGIDLVGERLDGAVIVGVGLPQLCIERDEIRDYFEKNGGYGFDYAYRIPGMNRVLQAAGRVIRSEQDRGFILLIDERFSRPAYRSLMPQEWKNISRVRTPDEIRRCLEMHG